MQHMLFTMCLFYVFSFVQESNEDLFILILCFWWDILQVDFVIKNENTVIKLFLLFLHAFRIMHIV